MAYIASYLAEELGLSPASTQDVLIAGALHDVAAVSSPVMVTLLDYALGHYQLGNGERPEDLHQHAVEGYILTRDFPPFAQAASAIRFHHVNWNFGRGSEFTGEPIPLASHILHLADRIAILPAAGRNILEQVAAIRKTITADLGWKFNPDIVAAFVEISTRESFWLDITCQHKEPIIRNRFGGWEVGLSLEALDQLVLERAIDGDVAAVLRKDFDELHFIRDSSQQRAELHAALGVAGIATPRPRQVDGVSNFNREASKTWCGA